MSEASARDRAVVIAAVVAVSLVVTVGALLARRTAGDREAAPPGAATGASPTWVAPPSTMSITATTAGPLIGPLPVTTTIPPPDDPPVIPSPDDPAHPAPLIHPFAALPGVAPSPNPPGPPASTEPLARLDGCDRHYGAVGQCIPVAFPPGTADKCGWLLDRGYGPLAVHAEDSQHLDADGDGTACGPGD